MNKEIVIHAIIGAAAVAAIYWAWKKIEAGGSPTPIAVLGIAGSGDAGWSGLGTSDPDMPPIFTFN